MEVSVSKRELLRLATRASAIADRKSSIPALSTALLVARDSQLTCSATDLYSSLVDSAGAKVAKPGGIAVNPHDLVARLKNMPDGPVSLSTKGDAITLKGEGTARRYTMRGLAEDQFPPISRPRADAPVTAIQVGVLGTLIAHTHFSISADESRPHISSALLEFEAGAARMVSTDGHRLSKCEIRLDVGAPSTMLLPLKAVGELRRLDEDACAAPSDSRHALELIQIGPTLFVRAGTATFGVKLVDAIFPPWRQVIPQSVPNEIRVGRAELADGVRAVSVASEQKTGGVKLSISKKTIRLESESPDRGDGVDEVPCDYDGPNLAVKFNAKYVLDVLGALTCDEVELGIGDELSPITIAPVGEVAADYLGVVMPMRM